MNKSVLIVSVGNMSGGVERYTITLGNALEKKGWNVHYAVRRGGWLSSMVHSDKVLQVGMGKFELLRTMLSINKYVNDNCISVVHCNSNNGIFASLFVKQSCRTKKIGVIHGDVSFDQTKKGKAGILLYEKLENILLKKFCSCCVAVSYSIKDILVKRGIKSEKIKVVHNGLEMLDYPERTILQQSEIRFLSVGNLLPVKNHLWLLKELKMLRDNYPDIIWSLDIYGEGPEREKLEGYIQENNLANVNLKGFSTNIRSVLNQYDVFIQPSLYESFGISVIEAMNAGCCVVAGNVGGMKEIITEDSGALINPKSDGQIINIIKTINENREKYRGVAQNGKLRAIKCFSIENMTEVLLSVYEGVDD